MHHTGPSSFGAVFEKLAAHEPPLDCQAPGRACYSTSQLRQFCEVAVYIDELGSPCVGEGVSIVENILKGRPVPLTWACGTATTMHLHDDASEY